MCVRRRRRSEFGVDSVDGGEGEGQGEGEGEGGVRVNVNVEDVDVEMNADVDVDPGKLTERLTEVVRADENKFREYVWDALREMLEGFADEVRFLCAVCVSRCTGC